MAILTSSIHVGDKFFLTFTQRYETPPEKIKISVHNKNRLLHLIWRKQPTQQNKRGIANYTLYITPFICHSSYNYIKTVLKLYFFP